MIGRSAPPDPRVHAYRRDLADLALVDRVLATYYARPLLRRCGAALVPVRAMPDEGSPAVSELLGGESFAVLDEAAGWAWGFCGHDGYVGYMPADALTASAAEPDHVVAAPAALVFAAADIKSPVVARWPAGVRFAGRTQGDFIAAAAGFVHARHARPIAAAERDPVAVAERLIGTPYRWGGRSGDGIDCSGLVQLALGLCGIAAPRDSDQQRDGLGQALAEGEPLRRGDLVFFPGHVGWMADGDTLVHANAHWMAVAAEPLADVLARLPAPAAIARRRLP